MNEQAVTLSVTAQEFNTIMAGLVELPAKLVINLVGKLQEQVKTQVEATKETA